MTGLPAGLAKTGKPCTAVVGEHHGEKSNRPVGPAAGLHGLWIPVAHHPEDENHPTIERIE